MDRSATQEVVLSRAKRIAALPREATVQLRQLISANWSRSLSDAVRAKSDAMSRLGESGDYREGLCTFRDRRPPIFKS